MLDVDISRLSAYSKKYLMLSARDEIYVCNRLMSILGVYDYKECDGNFCDELPHDIIQSIFSDLDCAGVPYDKTVLGDRLMDAISLRPSETEDIFYKKYSVSPKVATDWFYDYCVHNDYVKKSAIDRNIKWRMTADKGNLEITINLSKPEKNNNDLKRQLTAASTSYPKCTICCENEGYERPGFSRANMRTIRLKLAGEDWFWQYSPYAYFNEHGIAIRREHTPMVLDDKTCERLFDFVDLFPHYFIGNNAPLPRVGGSILMHDHFQGGGYILPMQRAKVRSRYKCKEYGDVSLSIVDWYNSVIRLEGDDRFSLSQLAYKICKAWEGYENRQLDIIPQTDEKHSTASLIARKAGERYILDIILRNNRCDERHPEGIFHAHRQYHNIKSESIGLIEAMGLFILPARLRRQLAEVESYLTGDRRFVRGELAEDMYVHADMIEKLLAQGICTRDGARLAIKREVEESCVNILKNTAVFKDDENGRAAFESFIQSIGI